MVSFVLPNFTLKIKAYKGQQKMGALRKVCSTPANNTVREKKKQHFSFYTVTSGSIPVEWLLWTSEWELPLGETGLTESIGI